MNKLTKSTFLKPILKGSRFDDHSIPVEVLSEFNAYRNLVLEVAKYLYRQSNTERLRLPSGFADQLTLKIARIEKGSAVAILEREFDATSNFTEFDEARDLVDDFISSQGNDTKFPTNLVYLFDSFGRTLRDDEEVLLCKPTQEVTRATKYNKQIRSQLLSINRKPVLGSVNILGRITDVNLVNKRFEILTHNGVIVGQYSNEFLELLRNAHRGSEETETNLVGTGLISPDNTISRIDKIQHMVCINEDSKITSVPEVESTLISMKTLASGWFDGEQGLPIAEKLIDDIQTILLTLYKKFGIVLPYLYPTLDAGIRAEWSWGNWEVSTEFMAVGNSLEIFATQIDGVQTRESKVNLADTNALNELAEFLHGLSKVQL